MSAWVNKPGLKPERFSLPHITQRYHSGVEKKSVLPVLPFPASKLNVIPGSTPLPVLFSHSDFHSCVKVPQWHLRLSTCRCPAEGLSLLNCERKLKVFPCQLQNFLVCLSPTEFPGCVVSKRKEFRRMASIIFKGKDI